MPRGNRLVARRSDGRPRSSRPATAHEEQVLFQALFQELQSAQDRERRLEQLNQDLQSDMSQWRTQYNHLADLFNRLRGKVSGRDEKIDRLQEEILRYKKVISSSKQMGSQLPDSSIQMKMECLYHAVRDWALGTVREGKLTIEPTEPGMKEWLGTFASRAETGSTSEKAQALVAIFARQLEYVVNHNEFFGLAEGGPIASAAFLHKSLQNISETKQQKKKQWLLLTSELFAQDEQMANEVKEKFLQTFLDHVQELLQGVCGLPISSTHIEKLETAIRPHLDVAQALQLQESEYVLELPPATLGGSAQPLVADDMEDQSGEDEGFLQASLFPMVLKRVPDDGQSEVEWVVIHKAKVQVKM